VSPDGGFAEWGRAEGCRRPRQHTGFGMQHGAGRRRVGPGPGPRCRARV